MGLWRSFFLAVAAVLASLSGLQSPALGQQVISAPALRSLLSTSEQNGDPDKAAQAPAASVSTTRSSSQVETDLSSSLNQSNQIATGGESRGVRDIEASSTEIAGLSSVDLSVCATTGISIIDAEGNAAAKTSDGYVLANPYAYFVSPDVSRCYVFAYADPRTFVALSIFYAKDANHVWIMQNPLPIGVLQTAAIIGADPGTFTLIQVGAPNSFTLQGELFDPIYTKDKNHVYYLGQIMPGADPSTFTLIAIPQNPETVVDTYTRDVEHVYYFGQVVAGAVPASFQLVDDASGAMDAEDANHEYLQGRVVR